MHLTTQDNPGRRTFLLRCSSIAGLLPLAMLSAGCENKGSKEQSAETTEVKDCDDLTQVSREDIALREKLAYVDESPIPENHCENCNLYLPPAGGKPCGGCMLFKGPVRASGYCTYWAPKV